MCVRVSERASECVRVEVHVPVVTFFRGELLCRSGIPLPYPVLQRALTQLHLDV